MASLTQNLSSPSGPTKSIVDTGPLIDPALNVIGGIDSVFSEAVGVFGAVKAGKEKKVKAEQAKVAEQRAVAREQRAVSSEQRAIEAAERAKVTFANTQDALLEKENLDSFKDDATRELMTLSRLSTRAKQGGSADTVAFEMAKEKSINKLLGTHPGMEHEMAQLFKERGFDNILFRGLEQEKAQVDSEEAARNAAESQLVQDAIDSGVGSRDMPTEELVVLGQELNLEKERVKNAQIAMENARADRTLNNEDRAYYDKINQRELTASANRIADMQSGAVVDKIRSSLTEIDSEEDFNLVAKRLPAIKAELNEARMTVLEINGYSNPEATKAINDKFDRQEAYVLDMFSGDMSYMKQQANKLSVVQTNSKVRAREAFPVLFAIEDLPKTAKDNYYEAQGVGLDASYLSGVEDFAAGVRSENASVYEGVNKLRDSDAPLGIPTGDKATPIDIKTARAYVKEVKFIHQESLKHVLYAKPGEQDPEKSEEFLSAHSKLIEAGQRLANTQGVVKDLTPAVNTVLAPGTLEVFERLMGNPETKFQAEALLKGTQITASSFIENAKKVKDDKYYRMEFNEASGKFEAYEDVEAIAEKREQIEENKVRGEQNTGPLVGPTPAIASFQEWNLNRRSQGPSERLTQKVAAANKSLDFLGRTQKYDSQGSDLSSRDYIKFHALGKFTRIEAPTAVQPRGNSAIEANAILSKYQARNTEAVPYLNESASKYGLPSALLHAVADQESGHLNPGDASSVVNHKGAKGVMQITKIAAKNLELDWDTLDDPQKNIDAGAAYLQDQMENFNGDIKDALLAYNAGPTRIRRWIREGRPIIEGKSWQDEAFEYAERIIERIEQGNE